MFTDKYISKDLVIITIKVLNMSIMKRSPKIETRYITITEDEYESMQRTIETLRDKEAIESITRGLNQMKEGKGVEHDAFVKKNLEK